MEEEGEMASVSNKEKNEKVPSDKTEEYNSPPKKGRHVGAFTEGVSSEAPAVTISAQGGSHVVAHNVLQCTVEGNITTNLHHHHYHSTGNSATTKPTQGTECDAEETIKKLKASLKQQLQEHLKTRFSSVHKQWKCSNLQEIYIDLHIVEGCTGGVSSMHEVSAINMRQAGTGTISEDPHVQLQKLFTYKTVTKVLTLGIAGVGKTIAVQKFAIDWAEQKANQDIDLVFVLQFRDLNVKNKYKLVELLDEFYPDLDDLEILLKSKKAKILFILDGFDESQLDLDFAQTCKLETVESVSVLVTSLITGRLLSSAHIWVTTRPAAAGLIPRWYFNLVTEVQGFNDPQKIEYFKKNVQNRQKATKIIDYVKKNKSLHIMCHIPVFCHIVAIVLDEILKAQSKKESMKTLTEIYAHFCVSQISRMDDKMTQEEKGQLLIKLGKLAFKHLEKGTLVFYKKDLSECDIDVQSIVLQTGVCTQVFTKQSGTTGDDIYSFVHLSVQEFLAALYKLYTHATENGKGSRSALYRDAVDKALQSQNGHLDLFVRFLLGLAPMVEPEIRSPLNTVLPQLATGDMSIKETTEYIKKKINKDISSERIINLFHCLNELGDNSLVDEINSYMASAERTNLTPAQCSAMAYLLLMSAEVLEEFDLNKYLRSEEGLRRMFPVASISKTVWLNHCNLSKASCQMMASVLQGVYSHLTELDMSDNDLQDEGVELLCEELKAPQCKLETLRLSGCKITDRTCGSLALVLKSSNSLLQLDLSYNLLGGSGVQLLCKGLTTPNCKLETLRLAGCELTDNSCEIVACALQSSNSLKELDLCNNDLGGSGVQLLSKGLSSTDCKLQILRLAGCELTDKSCETVASVLQSSNSLTDLDLCNNDLGDSGVQLLTKGLSSTDCKLQILRLSGCLISEKGCTFLAAALTSNPSHLKELDLSYNHPGKSGLKLLSARLEHPHCKLEKLNTDHCAEVRLRPGILKYACDLTLDPNTADRRLSLSEGNRKVTRVSEEQPYPDHPDRFDSWPYSQVLCREGLSGRCYWEAEWSGGYYGAAIAVAYKSIKRKKKHYDVIKGRNQETESRDVIMGGNDKSWALYCSTNSYSAWHNNKRTDIPAPSSSSSSSSRSGRVGVYLDWPAGTLSFYSVSSGTTRTPLHTFHSTFTEPLYPGFRNGLRFFTDSSWTLCQIT